MQLNFSQMYRYNEMSSKRILVVDIETTGLKPKKDLIVEIGIVELDLETGNKKIVYNKLVKEESFGEQHSDSWVFNNSDLKYDDVLNASELNIEEIQQIMNDNLVTAYNKSFDFGFLKSRGLIITELPCPMMLMTPICKLPGNFGNYKWPSVQEAWDFLFKETDYVELHRGADDALHEADIVYELYKRGVFFS